MKKDLPNKIVESIDLENTHYASQEDWKNILKDFNNTFENFIKNHGSNKKTLRR